MVASPVVKRLVPAVADVSAHPDEEVFRPLDPLALRKLWNLWGLVPIDLGGVEYPVPFRHKPPLAALPLLPLGLFLLPFRGLSFLGNVLKKDNWTRLFSFFHLGAKFFPPLVGRPLAAFVPFHLCGGPE